MSRLDALFCCLASFVAGLVFSAGLVVVTRPSPPPRLYGGVDYYPARFASYPDLAAGVTPSDFPSVVRHSHQ